MALLVVYAETLEPVVKIAMHRSPFEPRQRNRERAGKNPDRSGLTTPRTLLNCKAK